MDPATEIVTDTGIVRLISATDCVKDRLAWYYHDNDTECLEQAALVAEANDIDIGEIERWSAVEGKLKAFDGIRHRLKRGVQQDKSSLRGKPRR